MSLQSHVRHAEVLVVGAGPAGMAAATAAASCGRKVLVLDDNPAAGGQIWRESVSHPGIAVRRDPLRDRVRAVFLASGSELLSGYSVIDIPRPGALKAVAHIHGEAVQANFAWERLIMATGARERFLPFPGWTLPGVFGAGGLQALVNGGYKVAGKRVLIAGSGPLLLAVAAHLQEVGAKIVGVIEQASFAQLLPFAASVLRHRSKLLQGLQYRMALARVPYKPGAWPVAVEQSRTGLAVKVMQGRRSSIEHCDLLACGFHLVANTELAALLGCRFDGEFVAVDESQQTSVPNIFCAGEPAGIAGLDAALVQGEIAGRAAGGSAASSRDVVRRLAKEQAFGRGLCKAFTLRSALRSLATADTIVCRCEDVRFDQLQRHATWTDAKLQTRCGMGPCQGRICGPAVREIFGWKSESIRPPLFPVPVNALRNYGAREQESVTLQETL